jgi:hypothetical protein
VRAESLRAVTIFQQALLRDTTPALLAQVDLVAQRIATAARFALGARGDVVPAGDSLGIWKLGPLRLPFVIIVRRDQPGSWRVDTASRSLSPKLSALYAGVLRAIPPDSLWIVWPDGYAGDSVAFSLLLDGLSPGTSTVMTRNALFAVFRTRALIAKPALVAEHRKPPRYPFDAETRGIVGDVLLQFVVTKDGRADMSSLKVLTPSETLLRTSPFEHYYREFTNEAIAALKTYRFYPAHIGSCAVKQLVQFPFSFAAPRTFTH